MKKIILLLSLSLFTVSLTSCNNDDDVQMETVVDDANANPTDNQIQTTDLREDDMGEEAEPKEKTFPCRGWDCLQVTD